MKEDSLHCKSEDTDLGLATNLLYALGETFCNRKIGPFQVWIYRHRPSKDKHQGWGLLVSPFKYLSKTHIWKVWAWTWLCWSWRNWQRWYLVGVLRPSMWCSQRERGLWLFSSPFAFPLASYEQHIPPHAPRHDVLPGRRPSPKANQSCTSSSKL